MTIRTSRVEGRGSRAGANALDSRLSTLDQRIQRLPVDARDAGDVFGRLEAAFNFQRRDTGADEFGGGDVDAHQRAGGGDRRGAVLPDVQGRAGLVEVVADLGDGPEPHLSRAGVGDREGERQAAQ